VPDTIRAREFIVIDSEGRERAKLGAGDGAVRLEMGTGSGANMVLAVEDGGNARLEFRSGTRTIRVLIDQQRAQIKLRNNEAPESSCGLTLDGVGAWVHAEATPDVGVRILSNRGGEGTLVWLSEKRTEHGDPVVRTRCLHTDPREDSTSWQSDG